MYSTSSVERPRSTRRKRRMWWSVRDVRVWRGEAVETVKATVVGEGRWVERWRRSASIGSWMCRYMVVGGGRFARDV